MWRLRNIQNKKFLGNPSVLPAIIWLLQCICRQSTSLICFYLPAECRVNCSDWQWGLNKFKFSSFSGKRMLLVQCNQSVWPLQFLSETKITFLGVIFVQILQNIASIRNRGRWIVCTLPELYRLFFKTQAYVFFLWGFITNFELTYFKNSLYLQIKF